MKKYKWIRIGYVITGVPDMLYTTYVNSTINDAMEHTLRRCVKDGKEVYSLHVICYAE